MEHRGRMNREDRAKQFMPFAALKGYPEALRKKEKIVVPKIELPEEYQEELDRKLRQILSYHLPFLESLSCPCSCV